MPHSTRSSNASAPCRLEWRPSRLLVTILVVLAAAAAFAVLSSEMPRVAAWPLALSALAYGLLLAWVEWHRPCLAIVVLPAPARSTVDGNAIDAFAVAWRGPIASLRWRDGDGRTGRCLFWPDTLPAAHRRELRLAAPAPGAARAPASMAP
jgi:toxin CptA